MRNIHEDSVVFGEGDSLDEAVISLDERMLALLQRCEEQNIVLNDLEGKFILPRVAVCKHPALAVHGALIACVPVMKQMSKLLSQYATNRVGSVNGSSPAIPAIAQRILLYFCQGRAATKAVTVQTF